MCGTRNSAEARCVQAEVEVSSRVERARNTIDESLPEIDGWRREDKLQPLEEPRSKPSPVVDIALRRSIPPWANPNGMLRVGYCH